MESDLDGIAHILADKQLVVPKYQRPYAWDEKHVNDLLLDISDAIGRQEPEYFLGSIVTINRTDNSLEVVDGQQRLATVAILLAAIRDYLLEQGDIQRVGDLEALFLMQRDFRTGEVLPKLRLSDTDHAFFEARILARATEEARMQIRATRDSHERLERASELARVKVEQIVSQTHTPIERLADWRSYLEMSSKVILVQVRDDANAFTIFETLNDRGLDLAITDLVKNMLFSKAGSRIDEVQHNWVSMLSVLEQHGDDEVVVDFIRYFWSSKNGVTRRDELFSSIKHQVSSPQLAVDFSIEIQRNASLYDSILDPSAGGWSEYGDESQGHMKNLNLMGMKQIHPLLLAMLDTFPADETRKAMKYTVAWSVRLLTSGGLGGGTIESHYSLAAQKVRQGIITSNRDLRREMSSQVPADREFMSDFMGYKIRRSSIARYMLRELESTYVGESYPPLKVNEDARAVNLEHILPQNPSNNWPDLSQDEARLYYPRLGNLALLEKQKNKNLGNAPFEVKAREYKSSPFRLTIEVAEHSGWGPKEIESRQQKLAELACDTWPV